MDDEVSAPRCLAIKVLGVPGQRLPGSEGDTTQIFVPIDAPIGNVMRARKAPTRIQPGFAPSATASRSSGQAIGPTTRVRQPMTSASPAGVRGKHVKKHPSVVLALICAASSLASPQSVPAAAPPLPQELEIELAQSALPRNLRDNATIYILNPATGFEVARKGTNGFHAFVARTGDDSFRGSWPLKTYRDDILYPISFDAAGAKQNMRVFMDAARLQASGMAPQDLKMLIKKRYAQKYYKAPDRAGVSYMMSPILRTYTNPEESDEVATTLVPHVMHFVPNVTNENVGAAGPTPEGLRYFKEHGRWQVNPDPFVIMPGPHGYMVQFLGVSERAAVQSEYKDLLERLCKIKTEWCLPN